MNVSRIVQELRGRVSAPVWARELLLFGSIYFVLALINLRLKVLVTPEWTNGGLRVLHRELLRFESVNNQQSRLLQFYIPEFIWRAFDIPPYQAYMLQRWVFVFLALVCFHFFLRKWFDTRLAFAGVVTLAAIMPLTYMNDLQESSPLLLLTFVLGLWLIREGQYPGYTLLLFIGALNNETVLFLPAVLFFYNVRESKVWAIARAAGLAVLTALPALIVTGIIRYLTRDRPHLSGLWHWTDNWQGLWDALTTTSPLDWWNETYLAVWFLFGVLWVLAFVRFRDKPFFLQRAAWMIPFFILAHLLTGIIQETRLLLPLGFIVIPLAFFTLFPSDRVNELKRINE